MLRSITLLLFVIVFGFAARAQFNAYFHASPQLSVSSLHPQALNDYVASYNNSQYLPPYFGLMRDFGSVQATPSFEFGGLITSGAPEKKLSWFYGTTFSRSGYAKKNGAPGFVTYQLQLKMRDIHWTHEAGITVKKKFFAGASFSAWFRKVNLESAYIYPDGSKDLGGQYPYLGNFNGLIYDLSAGPYVAYRANRFVFFQFRTLLPLGLNKKADEQIALCDCDKRSASSVAFPRTFPQATTDDTKVMLNTFYGPSVQLSLGFVIGAGKNANRKEEDVNREKNMEQQENKMKEGETQP